MLVAVNGVVLCIIVLCIIMLLGRSHVVQTAPIAHQSEEDEELDTPVQEIDTPTSPLIINTHTGTMSDA